MTEQQIERCINLRAEKEKYEKALDALSNTSAKVVISYWGEYIARPLYIPVCSTEDDIKEFNLIVERFIKDKIQKIDEELKSL